ncbi:hypothetical protein MF271_19105 (plasmid) [Deinococcus sp. KNUC1210]|uniref:hypothetical protein n=1 Tax=Deinococcus sp. KNUC1210 TaxID=2917691 RepID=UPI001EF0A6CB|nr:hypothetical protein [Deinococcus sp. KNUC1210]ULH17430.1 hypothetical protein MF271_19105 [Deinococcus sp. KNUC1210]
MTQFTVQPTADLSRFLTPEALAEVRKRQAQREIVPAPLPTAPEGCLLPPARAAKLTDSQWRKAFAQTSTVMAEMLDVHLKADDGTEISAQLLDRYFDLFCFGMTVFPSASPDPRGVFRAKIRETLTELWDSMRGTIRTGLEEAEPLLRAEYQAQIDPLLSMVDAANTETTTERRRADAAERALATVEGRLRQEQDTAVWRAEQALKGEVKAAEARTASIQCQLDAREHELSLMRQEVVRLNAQVQEQTGQMAVLETQLSESRSSFLNLSFRKDKEPSMPKSTEPVPTFPPLEGITLAVHLKKAGYDAFYHSDTRTVSCRDLSAAAIRAAARACASIENPMAYVRGWLKENGLVQGTYFHAGTQG